MICRVSVGLVKYSERGRVHQATSRDDASERVAQEEPGRAQECKRGYRQGTLAHHAGG